jgi:hypothetical protein
MHDYAQERGTPSRKSGCCVGSAWTGAAAAVLALATPVRGDLSG